MKKLLFLIVCCAFVSCGGLSQIPLKGNYVDKPVEITSSKSFDAVWSNVIDLFATKGLSIKLIDKSSGLIVSEKSSYLNSYTFENELGLIEDATAFIVLETNESINGRLKPQRLTAEWNIRIKELPNKSTIINVNVTNIDAGFSQNAGPYSPYVNVTFNAKSTGVFEKTIADIVK